MKNNKDYIIEKFHQVKALGFVQSKRSHNTGIGKTFEDYVGVVENNLDEPDLAGFEIKTHREQSQSYGTLFTKSPNFPPKANNYLKDKFGSPYDDNPGLKNLHTSMFASKYNSYKGIYSFRLHNDSKNRVLKIEVFDAKSNNLIDDSVGYTYDSLERIIKRKIKNLFFVKAETKVLSDVEYFYFNGASIYTDPSLDKFLKLIDDGLIMYDIRIGSYKSGKNYGKAHDHGSGFRIMESNIHLLFAHNEMVE